MIDFKLDVEGWIRLPRSIMAEPIWHDKPFTKGQALVDLLFQTTFKANRSIESCGKRMTLVRGQAFIMKRSVVQRYGWSRTKLERFLKSLEKYAGERFAIRQEVVRKSSHSVEEQPAAIGTIITFVNFERICPK
ncbi:hypothetical protein ES703_109029 [subsurface metagenome]